MVSLAASLLSGAILDQQQLSLKTTVYTASKKPVASKLICWLCAQVCKEDILFTEANFLQPRKGLAELEECSVSRHYDSK